MRKIFAAAALMVALGVPAASAQTYVEPTRPLINQAIDYPMAARSRTWWKALEKQLILTLEKPVDQIDATTLQNVIYFAAFHRERLDLRDAAPLLLKVYVEHEDDVFRMMALSGIHTIGDRGTIRELSHRTSQQDSRRIRHMTVAVLYDHYGSPRRFP